MSVWALLVAAGTGERLGEERPKAFVGLGELPLLAEPLRRLDDSDWIDAIVVAVPAGLGGARDPARGRALRDEGRGRGDRRRDARGVGARRARRGGGRRAGGARARCGAAARHRRRDRARARAALGGLGRRGARPRRSPTPSSRSTATGSSAPSPVRSSSPCRRHRPSPPRRSGTHMPASSRTPRIARRWLRRGADASQWVEGDPKLLKVTTRADLELVSSWL